jgi:predicted glycosyltransferase
VPAVRIWIDLTNSPHVLVMRPIIEALRNEGHEVDVTARDYAQTLELLERFRIPHVAIGRHRGERLGAKALGLVSRSAALVRWARREAPAPVARRRRGSAFDLALGHGSNDVSVAAAILGIPCSTMFDYEFAAVQHHVNCRLADAVVVPDAIPPERLYRYGARGKIHAYPGLKEEYYLADFEPDEAVLRELALDPDRALVVVRTPPELALYHRFASDLFGEVLERLRAGAQARGLQVVVLPRTAEQRAGLSGYTELTLPRGAIDAQSLVAYADLVISAGGTMNREAAALGTPVLSSFQGRMGALDEQLIAEGRMRALRAPADLDAALEAPAASAGARRPPNRRDPGVLVRMLLSPTAELGGTMGEPLAPAPSAASSRKETL